MKPTDTKEKFSNLLQKTAEVGKRTADFGKKAAEKTLTRKRLCDIIILRIIM